MYMPKQELTERQLSFVKHYLKSGNIKDSAIRAGYAEKHARYAGTALMKNPKILKEIELRHNMAMGKAIATSADVMNFLTKAMNGEIKDQFGLDATLSDRIKAAVELAKRTVDVEQRLQNNETQQISITLKW